MKKKLMAIVSMLILVVCACAMTACGKKGSKPTEYGEEIVNGGFEQEVGALPGWTSEGQAFGKYGVVNTAAVDNIVVRKAGNNFFSGYDAGSVAFTGTLTSTPFKLAGTGKIGYRIGGGQDPEKCYIEILDHDTKEVLYKKGNTDFAVPYVTAQLVPNIADLSAHIGKTLVVKATDNDKARDGYSYLNLDDFRVLKTAEEVAELQAARDALLAEIGAPAFEENEAETTIRNGNFEDGLNNWKVLEGNAFSKATISASTKTFFGERVYNAVGDKFLDGYNVAEKNTGAMRSTKFTLGGDGYISLLIGGAINNKNYVAICDGSSDEELIKITCDHFKDPRMSLNLMRKFVDASEHIGKVLYVKIVDGDNRDDGFAALTVDDIRVSMTEAETKELINEVYKWAQGLDNSDANLDIRNYYETYEYPFQPDVLRLKTPIASKAMYVNGAVNVEAYLSEAEGSYGEVAAGEIAVQIDKVVFGTTEITTGFDSVDMSTPGLYVVHYSAHYDSLVTPATFAVSVAKQGDVINGDFETGDLAGWTVTGDAMGLSQAVTDWTGDANFHDPSGQTVINTHKEGQYFLKSDEGKTGTATSAAVTLGGDGIIALKFGAAGNSACYVAICDENGDELIKVTNTAFADPTMAHSMQRQFIDASAYIGQTVYIKIVDKATSGFGFMHVDTIRASLTYAEATAILEADKAWAETYRTDVLESDASMGSRTKEIVQAQHTYYENLTVANPRVLKIETPIATQSTKANQKVDFTAHTATLVCTKLGVPADDTTVTITGVKKDDVAVDPFDPADFTPADAGTYAVSYSVTDGTTTLTGTYNLIVLAAYDIENGGFEMGMKNWTVLEGNFNLDNAASINDTTYWGEQIPFNNAGYFLNGWNAGAETDTWRIRSTEFLMGGSGYISFRMGGRAARLQVYTAAGTQIAEYANTAYANVSFPYVDQGNRQGTMTTFVADLHEYVGQKLYIVLADDQTEDWGIAFFDEIVTYYETAPDVTQGKDQVMIRARVENGVDESGNPLYKQADTPTAYEIPWVAAVNVYVAPTQE